jgi:hypothetical protein
LLPVDADEFEQLRRGIIGRGRRVGRADLDRGGLVVEVVADIGGVASTPKFKVYLGKTPSVGYSGKGCVGVLADNNIETCMIFSGAGLYVSTAYATSDVKNFVVVEHEQMIGASVNYSTPDFVVPPGDNFYIIWTVNGDVLAGKYCATSWVADGAGYSNQGTACMNVYA